VTVLPGPSAVETALVASGLVGERYQFLGFLPRGAKALRELWGELAMWPHAAVAFESPKRLPASLRSLAEVQPARAAAVCRELTKRFEEIALGTATTLAERFAEPPKGEVVLVIGETAVASRTVSQDAVAAVAELVESGLQRRRAVDIVARLTRAPRNELYRRTL
jgi:16S rRNA (cytidine1402-2'-O)-methyltransferase